MTTALSNHTALAAKETLPAALRAAHACAAMALAAGGSAAAGSEWRFVMPAGAVGALEREVATSLLNAHGAADKRVLSVCAALASNQAGDARVPLALLIAGISLMMVFATLSGALRRRPTHTAASAPAHRPVPLKSAGVVTAPRRGEALLHIAMSAANTPRRRGVRQRRLGAVCACGGPPC